MAQNAVSFVPRNIVGPQIVKLRGQLDLSQSALAAKCQRMGWSISRGIVAGIEGQVRCVTDLELVLLARAFGTTLDELMPKAVRDSAVKSYFNRASRDQS